MQNLLEFIGIKQKPYYMNMNDYTLILTITIRDSYLWLNQRNYMYYNSTTIVWYRTKIKLKYNIISNSFNEFLHL